MCQVYMNEFLTLAQPATRERGAPRRRRGRARILEEMKLFSVTGAPALAMCCGFSASGLPLGIQIAGRPFDDATVLRIGHAYEHATPWRDRRPDRIRSAHRSRLRGRHPRDAGRRDPRARRNDGTPRRTQAPPTQLKLLLETAPYGLELVRRIRRNLPWSAPPAAPFRMKDG
jgi:hypothetical protein